MNEHINHLIEQCETTYADRTDGGRIYTEFDKEKLTELIIAECVAKVSEWDMGIDHPVGATDATSQVARDMVKEIKEHFGVK